MTYVDIFHGFKMALECSNVQIMICSMETKKYFLTRLQYATQWKVLVLEGFINICFKQKLILKKFLYC